MSDGEWVRSVLALYEGRLVRYAARITKDVERARDVVQDTFVRLCAENRERVEPRLAEWLFTVCRNRALEIERKEGRMASLDDDAIEGRESSDVSPALALEGQETAGHVASLLASLPQRQQEVIRLKFQEGLSYREISRITKLSETNVGYLIHVGLKTIRARLRLRASVRPEV